ncbi:NUDIX hydrolase [Listeria monocytogenes]|nr:NUDIX hydrolase [Listeria monocytogenes]GAT41722.1 NUDIX hydrolase [Listeria monocytogenes]
MAFLRLKSWFKKKYGINSPELLNTSNSSLVTKRASATSSFCKVKSLSSTSFVINQ